VLLVTVANVRGLDTPEERAGVVYVGRACAGWPGHRLANPFKLVGDSDQERVCVLDRYRSWLMTQPHLGKDLDDLWEQTQRGQLRLGCWCWPKDCHAMVLAQMLTARFTGRE
jgi:hypothetical protein